MRAFIFSSCVFWQGGVKEEQGGGEPNPILYKNIGISAFVFCTLLLLRGRFVLHFTQSKYAEIHKRTGGFLAFSQHSLLGNLNPEYPETTNQNNMQSRQMLHSQALCECAVLTFGSLAVLSLKNEQKLEGACPWAKGHRASAACPGGS